MFDKFEEQKYKNEMFISGIIEFKRNARPLRKKGSIHNEFMRKSFCHWKYDVNAKQ